jgi:hypothetical protein
MKQFLLLSFFAFTLFLFSCTSSLNTFSDYDKNTDLNKYKTFAWLSPGDSLNANPQNRQMELTYNKVITYASNNELKKKGMILDTQNPDVLFKYYLGMDQRTSYSQSPTVSVGVGVAGPYYYGGVAVPVAGGQVTEHRADEAFIYIQMFDTKTGYLLWTGGARKTVDNAADSQKNIQLALQAIFANLKIKHKTK